MQSAIWDFLSTEGFQPHGMCLLWRADVFWAHILSDVVIALSYFSIPVALVYFAFHRVDFQFRWVLMLFGAFIVACGITHVFGIWTMWVPDYGAQAGVKVITAGVSLATAIALWPIMPKLLAIPSTSDLAKKNAELSSEIASREVIEAKLRELNDELEARVAERTSQLEAQNDELTVARDGADKSNKAKSEFLASMSHEVRTPMSGVLGMLDLLKRGRLSDDQEEIVARASKAADGLLKVINDILDYSKLEAGKIQLARQKFSPRKTIRDAVDLLEHRIVRKGLTQITNLPDDLPETVIGDERRFHQIMVNLLGNAIKFTNDGSISVTVGCVALEGNRVQLDVSVQDTGIGIAPEIQKGLFERFYQGDASIARKFDGTGLGLAISRQLVELMQGTIGVESEKGFGSRFYFNASFVDGTALSEAAPEEAASTGTREDGGLRILIAEDNEDNQFYLEHLLTGAGHRVEIVENGMLAVEAAEREQYDLILMDIYMPEMDGTVAAKIIRTLDGPCAGTPIVALTANAMVGDREHYLSTGMDEYVSKPIDPNALFAAIWKVVRIKPVAAPA